jgi:hypothetical protein
MEQNELLIGTLVENPLSPEWGPGMIAHIRRDVAYVFFRGVPDRRAKRFKVDGLRLAPEQSDPILDNLPEFVEKDGEYLLPFERVTAEQAVRKFLEVYPGGFQDADYLGERKRGERNYKWQAHEIFVETLGNGQAEDLLARGDIGELVARAQRVMGRVNLLARTEATAFREGLADDTAATAYFVELLNLLQSEPTAMTFEQYANAVASLPVEGETDTDIWTVATILPFLARPDVHMFVKPTNTKKAADRLGSDLRYEPRPNWPTYDAVLRMSRLYMDLLKDHGPRDFLDIQSFFWVTSGR